MLSNYFTGDGILNLYRGDMEIMIFHGDKFVIQINLASFLFDSSGNLLPHLARTKLRIQELFNQAGFGLFLADGRISEKNVSQGMADNLRDGKSLYPLDAPVRFNLVAGFAPDLFRVILEKSKIKFPAEPVDKKIFERFFRLDGEKRSLEITKTYFNNTEKTEIPKGLKFNESG